MGNFTSKSSSNNSENCNYYKNTIHKLKMELKEHKNNKYLNQTIDDPFTLTINGGKRKKNTRRNKKRNLTRKNK